MTALFMFLFAGLVLRVLRPGRSRRGRSSALELYERRLRDNGWR